MTHTMTTATAPMTYTVKLLSRYGAELSSITNTKPLGAVTTYRAFERLLIRGMLGEIDGVKVAAVELYNDTQDALVSSTIEGKVIATMVAKMKAEREAASLAIFAARQA